MKVKITTLENKADGDIELSDNIFKTDVRNDILARVIQWQRARKQAGTHKVKERGEVHGTTKKPFAQKGTGNARQGSLKGPHQRGGGVAHGPRARAHTIKLPKKVRQLGLRSALSLKASEGKLIILKDAKLKDAKTKILAGHLDKMNISSALLIDGDAVDNNLRSAVSNIKNVDALPEIGANVFDILKHDNLILTVDAVKQLEKRLA